MALNRERLNESATVLDCTHSAAKRAANLHTFTLHGFCYPVHPPPFLTLSLSLDPMKPRQSERAIELGWESVSTVTGDRFISWVGMYAAAPFLPRGLPIKRSPRI